MSVIKTSKWITCLIDDVTLFVRFGCTWELCHVKIDIVHSLVDGIHHCSSHQLFWVFLFFHRPFVYEVTKTLQSFLFQEMQLTFVFFNFLCSLSIGNVYRKLLKSIFFRVFTGSFDFLVFWKTVCWHSYKGKNVYMWLQLPESGPCASPLVKSADSHLLRQLNPPNWYKHPAELLRHWKMCLLLIYISSIRSAFCIRILVASVRLKPHNDYPMIAGGLCHSECKVHPELRWFLMKQLLEQFT